MDLINHKEISQNKRIHREKKKKKKEDRKKKKGEINHQRRCMHLIDRSINDGSSPPLASFKNVHAPNQAAKKRGA
jgi:hypothetical protein